MKYFFKKFVSAIAILAIAFFVLFFYKCPIKQIFGIDCPGCGLTRAFKSLIMFDLKSAFNFHPMIFVFVIESVYYVFSRYIIKKRLSNKTEQIILISTIILTIIVWVVRFFIN